MPRIDIDQITVLQAVADRLIASVATTPALNDSTCFLSLQPLPPVMLPSNLFLTVAPIEGRFDSGLHDGGGIYQTMEEAGVVVTVFSRVHLDRGGRDGKQLSESARGLLTIKRLILKSLSGHDLLTSGGSTFLRNLMAPMRCDAPGKIQEEGNLIGYLPIYFSTDFDWDLQT